MAINYPNFPKLTSKDMGGFDLGDAIKSGLGNYNLFQEARYKPRNLENEAYGKELANKINEAKARYAMEQALADLKHTQAGTTNLGAQTSHLGAQTRGINIENRYLPEKLQYANKIQEAKARYAMEQALADLNYTKESGGHLHEQTHELEIRNKQLPEKLRLAIEAKRFENQHPLLKMPGMAGQIGSLDYIIKHPELFPDSPKAQNNRSSNPMEMDLIGGQRGAYPGYRESQLPSIGNRFREGAPEIPYEQLSTHLANAFNNPNESKLNSIADFFQEPNQSELTKIPALMTMGGNRGMAEVAGAQNYGNQTTQPPNFADLMRQSIINSINPKGKQGSLSPLGKLQQEQQDIMRGVYPGTINPIRTPEEQSQLLNENKAQIEAQIYGKGGKDAETIQLNKDLTREKINALRSGKPPTGKFAELEKLRNQYTKGSEDWNRYEKARIDLLESSGGITVYDPNGNPMVQIGGKGTGKGAGKGAQQFINSNGDVYQLPTTAVSSQLQNRISGEKIVTPYLKNIIDKMPQFQSGWVKAATAMEGYANKWLDADYRLPSDLKEGLSSMGIASEGLLREFGLNATTQNLKRTEAIITPGDGESAQGYKERATKQLIDFANTASQAQEMASSGILVKRGNNVVPQKGNIEVGLPRLDITNAEHRAKMTDEELQTIVNGGG